ncbi:MAG: ATP-binding protein [Oscillospiraceae bacterium]
MKKSLMRGFVLILLTAIAISSILNAIAFNGELRDNAKRELQADADVIAADFSPAQNANETAKRFAETIGDIRITIIAADGTVLGDSQADYKAMRNHADAPEILQAGKVGRGVSVRESTTLGKKLVYAATKTADGCYIRAAREVSGPMTSFISIAPVMLVAAILALLLAAYLTNRFSTHYITPVLEMNDSLIGVKDGGVKLNPKDYRYGELGEMAVRINAISSDISKQIQNIRREKDKLNYILDNVGEGFLLLDAKQNVLLINKMACGYLGCSKATVGKALLHATRNSDFLRAAEETMESGKRKNIDMEIGGRIIEAAFSHVTNESGFSAALIITMTDVSESRNAVKIRRDFFSNASHELKTPITSIKGSAELLCTDLPIPETKRKELLSRIGIEAERMSMLINDIIMISRMESGEIVGDFDNVDISRVINDSVNELRPLAERDGLHFGIEAEPIIIFANKKDIRELVSNLIVNAVKYNRTGGAVDVSLKNIADETVLTVHNDGEPIPEAQQGRVFERFYRVDSGRSKTVGGTGLGLAIVKHVVDSMSGTVSLESTEECGTTITVRLPK